jgi:hypothetical protein
MTEFRGRLGTVFVGRQHKHFLKYLGTPGDRVRVIIRFASYQNWRAQYLASVVG